MALICYYAQRFIACGQAKSGILSEAAIPALPLSGTEHDAVLDGCCIASRVRRSTSVTGE